MLKEFNDLVQKLLISKGTFLDKNRIKGSISRFNQMVFWIAFCQKIAFFQHSNFDKKYFYPEMAIE